MNNLSQLAKEIEDIEQDLFYVDQKYAEFIRADNFAGHDGRTKTRIGSSVATAAGTAILIEILKHAVELPLGIPLKEAFKIVATRRIESLAKELREGASARIPLERDVRESGIYAKQLLKEPDKP